MSAVLSRESSDNRNSVSSDPTSVAERPNSDRIPQGSLFVGDLSIFCKEADMTKAFEAFGEIVDVKVMRCDETHKNLCYGFVKFAASEDAQQALDSLNGTLLCGRPMRISWASHKIRAKTGEVDPGYGDNQFMNTSSVHVCYSTAQTENLITEEKLREVFGKYGNIQDITIKKFEIDPNHNLQRGYGFVHFPSSEDGITAALKCSDELKDRTIDNIHFKCDISHKLLKQLKSHTGQDLNIRRSGSSHSSGFHGTYRSAAATSRDHISHSQSSELSDLIAPGIDLSTLSMESLGGSVGPAYGLQPTSGYYYPAMVFPNVPPPSHTMSMPYPSENAYVDPSAMQNHSGYMYYPPSAAPASTYMRNINPGGKAQFSSSTTTTAAIMGDMKPVYSSPVGNAYNDTDKLRGPMGPGSPTLDSHSGEIHSAQPPQHMGMNRALPPMPGLVWQQQQQQQQQQAGDGSNVMYHVPNPQWQYNASIPPPSYHYASPPPPVNMSAPQHQVSTAAGAPMYTGPPHMTPYQSHPPNNPSPQYAHPPMHYPDMPPQQYVGMRQTYPHVQNNNMPYPQVGQHNFTPQPHYMPQQQQQQPGFVASSASYSPRPQGQHLSSHSQSGSARNSGRIQPGQQYSATTSPPTSSASAPSMHSPPKAYQH